MITSISRRILPRRKVQQSNKHSPPPSTFNPALFGGGCVCVLPLLCEVTDALLECSFRTNFLFHQTYKNHLTKSRFKNFNKSKYSKSDSSTTQ